MKQRNHLFAAVLLFLAFAFACSKSSDPPEPQMPEAIMEPVIFNFTGTWDSQCGQKSRPVMDSIRLNYPATPVINVHIDGTSGTPDDPLSNSQSELLARFFNVYPNVDSTYHIPYSWFMYAGGLGGSNYSNNVYHDLSTSIDWAKEHLVPAMALDIIPEISANNLTVKIKTEAVQIFPMPVFISVYLTEDDVNTFQANDNGLSQNLHHDVFRTCLNAFNGDKIADAINTGEKNEYSYSTVLEDSWSAENLKVTVIIWYRDAVYGNLVHLGKRVKLSP